MLKLTQGLRVCPLGGSRSTRHSNTICRARTGLSSAPVNSKRSAANTSQPDDDELDTGALVKYGGAIVLQTGISTAALYLLGQASHAIEAASNLPGGISGADAAKDLVILFFLVTSIKSRIFSPLKADRPTVRSEKSVLETEIRPSWAPPPIAFPIIWSTIGLLRCASSVAIWEASGRETVVLPLILFYVHLAVGDCWNHVKNVEKRPGVAVPGVVGCWLSTLPVVAAYYATDPQAGLLIAPSSVWIGVASLLVYSIWDLNGRQGEIYPTKGESRAIAAAAAATESS